MDHLDRTRDHAHPSLLFTFTVGCFSLSPPLFASLIIPSRPQIRPLCSPRHPSSTSSYPSFTINLPTAISAHLATHSIFPYIPHTHNTQPPLWAFHPSPLPLPTFPLTAKTPSRPCTPLPACLSPVVSGAIGSCTCVFHPPPYDYPSVPVVA